MERCVGCGIGTSGQHPIVGVCQQDEVGERERFPSTAVAGPSARGFVAWPVCGACHADPGHRQVTLKMSFFTRGQAEVAVEAAGSNVVGAR